MFSVFYQQDLTKTCFFSLASHALRACEARALRARKTLHRFLYWFWEKNWLFCSLGFELSGINCIWLTGKERNSQEQSKLKYFIVKTKLGRCLMITCFPLNILIHFWASTKLKLWMHKLAQSVVMLLWNVKLRKISPNNYTINKYIWIT